LDSGVFSFRIVNIKLNDKNYNSPARLRILAMLLAFLFHFFASQAAFRAQEDANMAPDLEV